MSHALLQCLPPASDPLSPLFAFVALVYLVKLRLAYVRFVHVLPDKRFDSRYYKHVGADAGRYASPPAAELNASRNLTNLFEVPTLYLAANLLLVLFSRLQRSWGASVIDAALHAGGGQAEFGTEVVLCWAYVACRALHSLVHVAYNNPYHRFVPWMISAWVLAALWVRLAIRLPAM